MTCCTRVLGRVAVARTVTAQGDAARLAGAQVHPIRPDFHALLALVVLRGRDRAHGFNMCTTLHGVPLHDSVPDTKTVNVHDQVFTIRCLTPKSERSDATHRTHSRRVITGHARAGVGRIFFYCRAACICRH